MEGRAGFLKTTLLDYPGEVASVIFLPGCNLRCPYCHNPALVNAPFPDDLLPLDDILALIDQRKHLIGGVCITGGEPLLSPFLPALIEDLHAMNLKVKLDTNGTLPERLAEVKPDYIAMDLKTSPGGYGILGYTGSGVVAEKITRSLDIIKESGIPHEIRTTFVPGIVNPEDLAPMLALMKEGIKRYVLTTFHPGTTLDPAYQKAEPYAPSRMEEFRRYFEEEGDFDEVVLRGL